MACRQLRKLEVLSTEREHVYQCDSCIWTVHVSPDKHPQHVETLFAGHKCEEHPLTTERQ